MKSKSNKIAALLAALAQEYPAPICELNYTAPHELLIAARLSAQCTDKRVNAVTPELFGRFNGVCDFAAAELREIEGIVKPCGLYKTKAASIKAMCELLLRNHGGEIPEEMDALLALPGIGRKTANLIRGELFGLPAIVADTHVIRLSGRLGLVPQRLKDPHKVELILRELIPPKESMAFCHRLVLHGRRVCKARKADCCACILRPECDTGVSNDACYFET
ncbi:MAG: endonuclease III [Oscillospiraceae bacterium]|nr:endonuclease III [Oscillospiraceae bacterium]